MSRLLAVCLTLLASLQPAAAGVCETVLGSGFGRLMHAPLWYYVGDRLLSPVTLVLIALALLTATKLPRLRGMAFIACLLAAIQAVSAIELNVFPDRALVAARLEGCGEASVAAAIVSSVLALLLAGAFVAALDGRPGSRR